MKISHELSKWETFLPIKANFQIPKFVEMFNSRIAKFMDIIGEQIYDELNQFIETRGGGGRGESIGFRGTINYDRANSLALCRQPLSGTWRGDERSVQSCGRLVKRPISMGRWYLRGLISLTLLCKCYVTQVPKQFSIYISRNTWIVSTYLRCIL